MIQRFLPFVLMPICPSTCLYSRAPCCSCPEFPFSALDQPIWPFITARDFAYIFSPWTTSPSTQSERSGVPVKTPAIVKIFLREGCQEHGGASCSLYLSLFELQVNGHSLTNGRYPHRTTGCLRDPHSYTSEGGWTGSLEVVELDEHSPTLPQQSCVHA